MKQVPQFFILSVFFLVLACPTQADDQDNGTLLEQAFAKNGFPNDIGALLRGNSTSPNNQLPGDLTVFDSLLIPDSRSLQRKNVSFDQPRVVLAVGRSPNSISAPLEPPSFIGFAEKTHSAEAISWNPSQKRYEFLLISDIQKGKTPTIKRADRAVCVTCHQAEGPIFSRFPWSETSFNPQIRAKISKSVQTAYPTGNVGFGFDGQVRRANQTLQAAKICTNLCGNDLKCRQALLVQTISHLSFQFNTNSPSSSSLTPLVSHWPKDGFRYPSSVLPDRDPLANEAEGGLTTIFVDSRDERIFFPANSHISSPTYDETQSVNPGNAVGRNVQNNFGDRQFENLGQFVKNLNIIGIKSLADPTTPRPEVSEIQTADLESGSIQTAFSLLGPACFGWSQEEINRIVSNQLEARSNAENNTEIRRLLETWPPPKEKLLTLLSPNLDSKEGDDLAEINCLLEGTPASPIGNENQAMIVALRDKISAQTFGTYSDQQHALGLFQKYCSECHSASTFEDTSGYQLSLDNLKELQSNSLIKKYLKAKIMPAKDAKIQPTDEERAEMLRVLDLAQ